MNVAPERTGWRDLALNNRHRDWGWNVPAADLDFLEYDGGRAVALVEYKRESAKPLDPSTATNRALVDLANRAGLPIFGVRYASDFAWFQVSPLNTFAVAFVSAATYLTEFEYVHLLYRMRGRTLCVDTDIKGDALVAMRACPVVPDCWSWTSDE